ncbi:group II intron maturase-specific domain-containing protein [Nocardioides endophyticus]
MQTKLHRWSNGDPTARFDDLFNLVVDPAFLRVAWEQVAGNTGARSAGIDGLTVRTIEARDGRADFLADLRWSVKSGQFSPSPVKQRKIPKSPGKFRTLGIPTVADRVIQASLVLVLGPIFEADIEACFDEIDHTALMGRVRRRVGDKRVLALVKAFLKAGALSEDQVLRHTDTGTPQGGILSPPGSGNPPARPGSIVHGAADTVSPVYRLVRCADDFRIQRHREPGTSKSFVYTFPARKSVAAVRRKVKAITQQGTNQPLSELLRQLNMLLRGWTRYFQHGVPKRAFGDLRHYTWSRAVGWLRNKRRKTGWKALRRRYSVQGWWPNTQGSSCSTPQRWRSPVTATGATSRHREPSPHLPDYRHDLVQSRMR